MDYKPYADQSPTPIMDQAEVWDIARARGLVPVIISILPKCSQSVRHQIRTAVAGQHLLVVLVFQPDGKQAVPTEACLGPLRHFSDWCHILFSPV